MLPVHYTLLQPSEDGGIRTLPIQLYASFIVELCFPRNKASRFLDDMAAQSLRGVVMNSIILGV
jgi:hypothetical protein